MAEIKDWELSDDYFQAEDSAKELKLEDFMTEEPSEHDGSDGTHSVPSETLLTRTCSRRLSKTSMKFSHELRRAIPFRRLLRNWSWMSSMFIISRCLRRVSGRTMRLRWRIWL